MSSLIQNKAENLNNSIMVLTIDIGNGICDKLRIHDINNYQEETYDFCAKNNLDFNTMKEINHQIQTVLSDSGVLINEIIEEKPLYKKKNQNKLMKNNYLNSFKNALNKKKEELLNKKVIKRHNEKPLNHMTQRMKDSNRSNNYSYLMSNTRGNSNSTKTSSTKESNIKTNVKNAFHAVKGNSERLIDNNYNVLKFNNKINNIKSFRQNSNKFSCLSKDSISLYNNDENNKVLFSYSHSKKNNDKNKANKKIKESIEILNKDDNNNNKKEEMMIIEFDSYNSNNNNSKKNNKEEKSKKKDQNDQFSNILNSISLINKDYLKINDSSSEKIIYRANKTESNEQKSNFTNLTNKSEIYLKSKMNYNLSYVDKIKDFEKIKEEKIKNLKEQKEKQFKKLYTFRPLINHHINTEIDQENKNHKRTNTSSRFDRLYDYRLSYKENKKKLSDKYEEKYSFHPKINSLSCYPLTKMTFNERLKLYSNKSKDVINKLQKSLEKKRKSNEKMNLILNTEKYQNLLKEKKEPKNLSRKKEGIKEKVIYGKKSEEKTKLLTDKNMESKSKTSRSRHMSSSIINNKKLQCFKKIFKLLDSDDNDGKITYKNINIKSVPKDIKNILEPIFTEMKDENETLTESEFVFVCDKLYESLKYQQKQKLLSFDKDNKNQKKQKPIKDDSQISKKKTNSTITNISSEKINKNLNRVASCETGKNKIKIKRNNEIKKINYYFSKPKYLMQINNFINEDKKIRENKNIINNISLSAFLKNKNNEKSENNNNTFNISKLVVQNLNNKIDKEIKYRNDDVLGKI